MGDDGDDKKEEEKESSSGSSSEGGGSSSESSEVIFEDNGDYIETNLISEEDLKLVVHEAFLSLDCCICLLSRTPNIVMKTLS